MEGEEEEQEHTNKESQVKRKIVEIDEDNSLNFEVDEYGEEDWRRDAITISSETINNPIKLTNFVTEDSGLLKLLKKAMEFTNVFYAPSIKNKSIATWGRNNVVNISFPETYHNKVTREIWKRMYQQVNHFFGNILGTNIVQMKFALVPVLIQLQHFGTGIETSLSLNTRLADMIRELRLDNANSMYLILLNLTHNEIVFNDRLVPSGSYVRQIIERMDFSVTITKSTKHKSSDGFLYFFILVQKKISEEMTTPKFDEWLEKYKQNCINMKYPLVDTDQNNKKVDNNIFADVVMEPAVLMGKIRGNETIFNIANISPNALVDPEMWPQLQPQFYPNWYPQYTADELQMCEFRKFIDLRESTLKKNDAQLQQTQAAAEIEQASRLRIAERNEKERAARTKTAEKMLDESSEASVNESIRKWIIATNQARAIIEKDILLSDTPDEKAIYQRGLEKTMKTVDTEKELPLLLTIPSWRDWAIAAIKADITVLMDFTRDMKNYMGEERDIPAGELIRREYNEMIKYRMKTRLEQHWEMVKYKNELIKTLKTLYPNQTLPFAIYTERDVKNFLHMADQGNPKAMEWVAWNENFIARKINPRMVTPTLDILTDHDPFMRPYQPPVPVVIPPVQDEPPVIVNPIIQGDIAPVIPPVVDQPVPIVQPLPDIGGDIEAPEIEYE
jgi:hypothetical protein